MSNLVFDSGQNVRWIDIVAQSTSAAPIDADFQSALSEAGNPAVAKLFPRKLVRLKIEYAGTVLMMRSTLAKLDQNGCALVPLEVCGAG